jgi:L-seryl-tRNA(Ser) seleniumtransferase
VPERDAVSDARGRSRPAEADPRRRVPRTDAVLADPRLVAPLARLDRAVVKAAVVEAQQAARDGRIGPDGVVDAVLESLPTGASSLRPTINATGVVLHTNLGRAALSDDAVAAMADAAGSVDVELDLATGRRARRGRGTLAALAAAVPEAEDVLVVNNGAAALLLAVHVLAAGREAVISRGEMVEIGDGFRLPTLLESTGARLREVGTTNRTDVADYVEAVGESTGCVLKVHPSNFRVLGFTGAAEVPDLAAAGLGVPLVVDTGSGLLADDPRLPGEPSIRRALADGADLVTSSGDKLLGGPQAGLVLGRADLVRRLRRSPLARALRVDKITLAALEATLRGRSNPTADALAADQAELRSRAERLCERLLAAGIAAEVVRSDGAVGGGGAPGLPLPGWAVAVPEDFAAPLRTGNPPVLGRVERGRALLDLRCVQPTSDEDLAAAVVASSLSRAPERAAGHR